MFCGDYIIKEHKVLCYTLVPYRTKRFTIFASHLPMHTHTHTDGGRASMQGAGLTIGSNMGFSVLLKDTLTHGQEKPGELNQPPLMC